MRIFISWSGERSLEVARTLHDWLPGVIQSLKPWMSFNDIEKGARWRTEVADQLEEHTFGIICLTPENLTSPWLLFEAGALSKVQKESYTWTLLYDLNHSDVKDPLAQFQHTKIVKQDIKNLLKVINRAQGDSAIAERVLDITFERSWDDLENRLNAIPIPTNTVNPERSEKDMLTEVLDVVRGQTRRSADDFQVIRRWLQQINAGVVGGQSLRDRVSFYAPEETSATPRDEAGTVIEVDRLVRRRRRADDTISMQAEGISE